MPRGGRRSGTAGVAYAQRSDLNASRATSPNPKPVYGAGAAAQQSAATVPPSPQPAPAEWTGQRAGTLGPLTAPTQRPDEPLTTGLPTGPGAGPEVLSATNQTRGVKRLLPYLPILEHVAQQPDASPEIVSLTRFLRGLS